MFIFSFSPCFGLNFIFKELDCGCLKQADKKEFVAKGTNDELVKALEIPEHPLNNRSNANGI